MSQDFKSGKKILKLCFRRKENNGSASEYHYESCYVVESYLFAQIEHSKTNKNRQRDSFLNSF
jgi:hypothetical protein